MNKWVTDGAGFFKRDVEVQRTSHGNWNWVLNLLLIRFHNFFILLRENDKLFSWQMIKKHNYPTPINMKLKVFLGKGQNYSAYVKKRK